MRSRLQIYEGVEFMNRTVDQISNVPVPSSFARNSEDPRRDLDAFLQSLRGVHERLDEDDGPIEIQNSEPPDPSQDGSDSFQGTRREGGRLCDLSELAEEGSERGFFVLRLTSEIMGFEEGKPLSLI